MLDEAFSYDERNLKEVFEGLLFKISETHTDEEIARLRSDGESIVEKIQEAYRLKKELGKPRDSEFWVKRTAEGHKDDELFKELHLKWNIAHHNALRTLDNLNKGIERSIASKESEAMKQAKRQEWERRPETATKQVERVSRTVWETVVRICFAICFFITVFVVITAVVGNVFAIVTSQLLDSALAGFVLAALVAIAAVIELVMRMLRSNRR